MLSGLEDVPDWFRGVRGIGGTLSESSITGVSTVRDKEGNVVGLELP